MPDVQLREVTDQIRDLIQAKSYAEAISHCLYVLEYHPKHIETHALLGEACLERKSYRDAQDAFLRVLSADPENLVARVGLGVIYQEQGGLEESIWEWERAFELAPGDVDVRQQLQTLLRQRTGVSPARLRLNRAALGRLYMRNSLFERAIAEFQAVLSQEPDRIDIQVALVEALWHAGQHLDALDTCQTILEDLPSCLKANLILGEIWMRTGHEDEAEQKLALVTAMDPEHQVARAIMGEQSPLQRQMAWVPMPAPDQPWPLAPLPGAEAGRRDLQPAMPLERARRRPVDAADLLEPAEEMPDWVRDLQLQAEEPSPPAAEAGEAELETGELPEWLRDIEEIAPEVETLPEEIRPQAEAPAWLRELEGEAQEALEAEMASGRAGAEPLEEPSPAEPEGLPPWLETYGAGEEEAAPEAAAPEEPSEIPCWLQDIMAAATAGVAAREVPSGEAVPESEAALAAEAPPVPEVALLAAEVLPEPEAAPPAAEALPEPEAVLPAAEVLPEPDAMLAVAEGQPPVRMPEPFPLADVPPSLRALVEAGILDEGDIATAMAEMSPEALAAQQAVEVPDWLRDLSVAAPATEAVPAAPEEAKPVPIAEPEAAIPLPEEAWAEAPPPSAPAAEPRVEPEVGPALEVPASLRALVDLGILDEAGLASALAEMTPEELAAREAEEIPDWLRDLAPEGPFPAADQVVPPLPEAAEGVGVITLPAWLRDLAPPEALPAVEPEAEMLPEPEAVALEAEPEAELALPEPEIEIEVEPIFPEPEVKIEPELEAVALEPEPIPPPWEVEAEPEAELALPELEVEIEVEPIFPEPEVKIEPELEAAALEPEPVPPPWEVEAEPEAELALPEPEVEIEVEPIFPEPEAEIEPEPEAVALEPEPLPALPEAEPEAAEVKAEAPALERMLAQLEASPRDYTLRLQVARHLQAEGRLAEALDQYERLVNAGRLLPEVLDSLPSLVETTPEQYRAWQILGDAYMKTDRLNEALAAYREARRALHL